MEQLFSTIPHGLMTPSFREHADGLCRDINLFLVSKGKSPDRYPTLVSFMKKTELAQEYMYLAGEMGVTPIMISGYIDDDWLAGYWGWVEDGGSNSMLNKLGLDAPSKELVLCDLLSGGIARISRLMGLQESPESFRLAKDLSRHVLNASVKQDVEMMIANGAQHAGLSIISLARLLGTRQYKEGARSYGSSPEDISLIVGQDDELFDERFFAEGGVVFQIGHPDLDAMEHEEGGLTKLDALERVYRSVIYSDSDLNGKLGKVKMAAALIQPVMASHLYRLVEQGQSDLVWRSALGRATILVQVFPTKSAQEYVSASIALMLVQSVERDLCIELPCKPQKLAAVRYLESLWSQYDDDERQAVMAVLSQMAHGGLLDLHVDKSLAEPAMLFKACLDTNHPEDLRLAAVERFEGSHLTASYRRQLWPFLITHSGAISKDRLLFGLIPHLAVAWQWGQHFHHKKQKDPLYRSGILAHDGWKNVLGKSPDNTVKALTIAHREQLLDLDFSASLNVTGDVLRRLEFKLPAGMADQTLSADLGL